MGLRGSCFGKPVEARDTMFGVLPRDERGKPLGGFPPKPPASFAEATAAGKGGTPNRISRCAPKKLVVGWFVVLFAANACCGATNDFKRQILTLPSDARAWRFIDVNGSGRSDLFVIDPAEKALLVYRQRTSGFADAPDQRVKWPPQTAWMAFFDVDPRPGRELLMSTARGLIYYCHNGGIFDAEPRTLVQASQVFTNDGIPALILLPTNASIPLISATQAVLYRPNNTHEWTPGQPVALEAKDATWYVGHEGWDEWAVGQNPSRGLLVWQSFRSEETNSAARKSEDEAIRKLMEKINQTDPDHPIAERYQEVTVDGQKAIVLWRVSGVPDSKTDAYVFLRGVGGQLPERPTQVLHCRGTPIPNGSAGDAMLMADLKGDGTFELVLVELKSNFASAGSLLDAALSQGLDWALTIRTFNHGAFSRAPDATIPFKAAVQFGEPPYFIRGDFNGDGRPDLVVQHSAKLSNIYFSTKDGRWFAPQPAMTFESPVSGTFDIEDLNGDGRSDIVVRDPDNSRLFIFLTQPQGKGSHP
jgi:hypothetical protein